MSVTSKQFQAQIDGNKKLIERRDMALKLSTNREFKKLILDEFIVREMAAFAAQGCDPTLRKEEREIAVAMSQAGGVLKRWLRMIVQMGDTAQGQMEELEEALEIARQEEDAPVETDENEA